MALRETSEHYEKETCGKSEGFIISQWDRIGPVHLQGGFLWSR